MFGGVADTHAALWFLFNDGRLSVAANRFIEEEHGWNRLSRREEHVFEQVRLTIEMVDSMQRVPRDEVPDMPDPIIAATAVYLGVPVLSRDGKIRSSHVRTIW